jgi:protein pelota
MGITTLAGSMKILKFNDADGLLRLRPDSFDDLYLLARITANGDAVESRSWRRFRASEGDVGEQKEVTVKIAVEKVELDKGAGRLRLTGKILSGRPEEFIRLGSYHTINIGDGDIVGIQKSQWESYILRRVKQAVADTRKPKLGAVAIDDEKATLAYVKSYGVEIITEMRSHLSKKMKEAEYARQKTDYLRRVAEGISNMKMDVVVVAGPGFAKEDLKRHISEEKSVVTARLVYVPASDAERSGIREAMKNPDVANVLEAEHVRREFRLLNMFLGGLVTNSSSHGESAVHASIDSHTAGVVMVNDDLLNDDGIKKVLGDADRYKVPIEIFNSEDEAGRQLASFKGIASISHNAVDALYDR